MRYATWWWRGTSKIYNRENDLNKYRVFSDVNLDRQTLDDETIVPQSETFGRKCFSPKYDYKIASEEKQ